MRSLLFLAPVILLFSCKPKTGSVSGNVFWKYNEYVGNKPDAGASVTLYSLSDSTKENAKCDIKGDFHFDKVKVGRYLVLVRSKNTTGSAENQLASMLPYLSEISKVIGKDLVKKDFAQHYHKLQGDLSEFYKNNMDGSYEQNTLEDSLRSYCSSILFEINLKSPTNSIPLPALEKYHYATMDVKPDKSETIVVDFGITYN